MALSKQSRDRIERKLLTEAEYRLLNEIRAFKINGGSQ